MYKERGAPHRCSSLYRLPYRFLNLLADQWQEERFGTRTTAAEIQRLATDGCCAIVIGDFCPNRMDVIEATLVRMIDLDA